MKYELSLALAFIKSKKRKWGMNFHTLLSVLGITVGVAFLIFALSIYDGYVKKIETIIFSFYPPITLQAPLISQDDEGDTIEDILSIEDESETQQKICNGVRILEDRTQSSSRHREQQKFQLDGFPDLKRRLESITGVTRVSPVIFEEGTFTYSYANGRETVTHTHPLRFFGVQCPGAGGSYVPEINRTITDPRLLKKLESTGKHYVILSHELYRRLFGTSPGAGAVEEKTIRLRTGSEKSLKIMDLEVAGVFKLGMHNISKNMVITSFATAQEIFSLQGKATFLGASLKQPYQAEIMADRVREAVAKDNYPVFHWLTLAADMFNSLSFYRKIIFILLFMSILITSFNIYNTLNIMILERKRQIGILVSMGVKKKSLYRVFFIISQIEALAGVIIGAVAGTIMGFFFSDYLNRALAEFLPIHDATIILHAGSVLLVAIFVCLLSWGTAFLATRKGVNIDPVDALRSE